MGYKILTPHAFADGGRRSYIISTRTTFTTKEEASAFARKVLKSDQHRIVLTSKIKRLKVKGLFGVRK